MKRDFELVRKLLLDFEGEKVDLSPYTEQQILYHKALLIEDGLAEGPKPHYSSVMSIKIYWVNGLIYILINSIFPQGNFYNATPNLEEGYEKVHYSVIHGGT